MARLLVYINEKESILGQAYTIGLITIVSVIGILVSGTEGPPQELLHVVGRTISFVGLAVTLGWNFLMSL